MLRVLPPGVRLDREMARAGPKQLAAELDQESYRLADESDVELAQAVTPPDEVRGARLVRYLAGSGVDLHELARDRQPRRLGVTPLLNPGPTEERDDDGCTPNP